LGARISFERREERQERNRQGSCGDREVWRERIINDVGILLSEYGSGQQQLALGLKRPNNSYLIMGTGCAEANVRTFLYPGYTVRSETTALPKIKSTKMRRKPSQR